MFEDERVWEVGIGESILEAIKSKAAEGYILGNWASSCLILESKSGGVCAAIDSALILPPKYNFVLMTLVIVLQC